MKIGVTAFFLKQPTYFTNLSIFMWKIWPSPSPLKPLAATLSLKEANSFGCLRFNAFDFQLKFNLKYTNFVLKEN